MKLSIIIPVYNEAKSIEKVMWEIKSVQLPGNMTKEIIIIDDGSTDRTPHLLKKYSRDLETKILYQEKNTGKTSAVRLGVERSTGDIILIQDADLEYSPANYPDLIGPIMRDEASVVYGSRFKGSIKKMPFINRIANIFSNMTLNILFNAAITDVNTCHKVFRKNALREIEITSKNFMFETEVTAKLLQKGHTIHEVPIQYTARSKKEGKKISWWGALEMYWGIIKYKYQTAKFSA